MADMKLAFTILNIVGVGGQFHGLQKLEYGAVKNPHCAVTPAGHEQTIGRSVVMLTAAASDPQSCAFAGQPSDRSPRACDCQTLPRRGARLLHRRRDDPCARLHSPERCESSAPGPATLGPWPKQVAGAPAKKAMLRHAFSFDPPYGRKPIQSRTQNKP